jgi:hypothetical protein
MSSVSADVASLPGHGYGHVLAQGVYFIRFLAEGAGEAAPDRQTVLDEGSVDSLVLSDLLSDHGTADDVGDWNTDQKSVYDARLAHLLGDLAFRVARHEVRDDAYCAVAEATEKARLEFTHSLFFSDVAYGCIKNNLPCLLLCQISPHFYSCYSTRPNSSALRRKLNESVI